MRGAQLPPHLALSNNPCRHWIVSASNGSESYQLFCKHQEQLLEGKDLILSYSPSSISSRRFRLDHLLPKDWSALLRQCRRFTSPQGSFNFSSPGDAATTVDRISATSPEGKLQEVVNAAFMHIVERTSGDFVPNNMIYHELQQRYVVGLGSTEGAGAVSVEFCSWLRHLQEQKDDDDEGKGKGLTCVDFYQKKDSSDTKVDPLAQGALAMEKTMQNQKICLHDTLQITDDGGGGEDAVGSIFTFFPHVVKVADCIPYRSRHFVVMVNQKPIVPGHLMVVPIRCVGTIGGLMEEEVEDWGHVIELTLCVLKRLASEEKNNSAAVSDAFYPANLNVEGGFSIAIQQGALAGQTVPHLHTHVIPFDPHGFLAGKPEDEELQKAQPLRTGLQMREETEMLRPHFDFLLTEKQI